MNTSPSPEIESKADLITRLEKGCKPPEHWRIGSEHEKFAFSTADNRPLPYAGNCSIRTMMETMRDMFGWQGLEENGNLIALTRDGAGITLEPGGQFELSGAPLYHLHQTCAEVQQHLHEVRTVADKMGVSFLGLGFSPLWRLEETPRMPKARYAIMAPYMKKIGRLGSHMMFRSATVQVNLDYASEADMVKKMRVGLALQPVATALFANSPFADGRPNGFLSYRAFAWNDTDPDRTGMMHFVFEDGFGFERYIDHVLNVPMYFVYRDGTYIDCSGASFHDFLRGELSALPGVRPTLSDFDDQLSSFFPDVRMKTIIEMRGADSGPWSRLCALPAFWVGLLYDKDALDEAWELVRHWSAAEREMMRLCVPSLGLKTPIRSETMGDVAKRALAICRRGLERRARLSANGEDETCFLTELEDIAGSGITPAEVLLRRYHGPWKGDITRIFSECAY